MSNGTEPASVRCNLLSSPSSVRMQSLHTHHQKPSKPVEIPLEGAQGLTRTPKACARVPRGQLGSFETHQVSQGCPRL
ncbi:hypothetical protein C8R44DRAFT_767219 [Mycena epipterygia]|nr:hypothetical protein C8R44DRAFT_767219 [Mycena epipterygia]